MGKAELEAWVHTLDISLTVCALLAAIGAAGTFGFGYLRLKRGDELQAIQTAENLALQVEVATLQGKAAEATQRAAEAEQKAAEAKLALEEYKAPRMLGAEPQDRIAIALHPFFGTPFDVALGPMGDPEPIYLFRAIYSALVKAGWTPLAWTGGGETYTEIGLPPVGLTSVTNVIVDVHPSRWAKFGAAASALAAALAKEGVAAIADSEPTSVDSDAVHIRIGRKL